MITSLMEMLELPNFGQKQLIFCEKKLKIQHKYCPTLIWKAFSTAFVSSPENADPE